MIPLISINRTTRSCLSLWSDWQSERNRRRTTTHTQHNLGDWLLIFSAFQKFFFFNLRERAEKSIYTHPIVASRSWIMQHPKDFYKLLRSKCQRNYNFTQFTHKNEILPPDPLRSESRGFVHALWFVTQWHSTSLVYSPLPRGLPSNLLVCRWRENPQRNH